MNLEEPLGSENSVQIAYMQDSHFEILTLTKAAATPVIQVPIFLTVTTLPSPKCVTNWLGL